MPDKEKQPEFVVTDRRKFTSEGERREDVVETAPKPTAPPEPPKPKLVETEPLKAAPPDQKIPPPPSADEQAAQKQAYQQSTRDIDSQINQLGGRRAQDFQITFERFLASLYMSALMQLGLLREEGATGRPQVDIIGARQTIDTIELLAEKTKGNLTAAEENFVQNCLYELRMAYVDITNAIARPPQPPEAAGKK